MNRKYFAYAILAILIAFSIGVLAISLGVHFSSAPVAAQEVPTEPPASPPSTPDSPASPPASPPPAPARVLCSFANLNGVFHCDFGGYVTSRNPHEHLKQCDAGHWYYECWDWARRVHTAHNAPAPAPTPAPAPAPTPSSRAQSPSQSPSQNPPASPPQSSCTPPSIKFKSWAVGRSSGTAATVPLSFITTDETTCKVKFEVTYDGSHNPSTTCEITSGAWTVNMSHEFTVSGDPTETAPGEGFSKVWTYEATLKGPGNSTAACSGTYDPYPGRGDKPMDMTVTFTGTHSRGTVSLELKLKQDEKDGIRQEHVDYGQLVIPARNEISAGAARTGYNHGHYNYLIDLGLDGMREAWAKWCNPSFTGDSLHVTSAYRHPYHNFQHAGAKLKYLDGLHQYGCALDVRGKAVNAKGESVRFSLAVNKHMDLDGDQDIDDADRDLIVSAGREATGSTFQSWKYPAPRYHVHADWRPSYWKPSRARTKIGSAGTVYTRPSSSNNDDDSGDSGGGGDSAPAAPAAPTTPATPKTTPTTPTTPAAPSNLVRCGHGRNGNACSRGGWASSREAHKVTCPAGHRYYECSLNGNRFHANCRARRSGEVRCAKGSWCRSGGWASSRNAHQTTCGQGHTYWSCWPRSVSYHRGH